MRLARIVVSSKKPLISITMKSVIKPFLLSLTILPIILISPSFGLLIWFLSFCLLYRFFSSATQRRNASKAKELGKYLSSATADLAFSLAVTGSEFIGAEALARGNYSIISDLAHRSLIKSLDGTDVRSSLTTYFRHQRTAPTSYLVELLLSRNPRAFDVEVLLEHIEEYSRRNFSEFTRRLNALLPAYFFIAFFMPFSALILSTLIGSFATLFLAAFFPTFSFIMWLVSYMLSNAEANM